MGHLKADGRPGGDADASKAESAFASGGSPKAEEPGEEVADYVASLLERLRTTSGGSGSNARPATPSPARMETQAAPVAKPEPKPAVELPPLTLADFGKTYVASATPAESKNQLEEMRKLANASATTAVAAYQGKRQDRTFLGLFVLSLVAIAVSFAVNEAWIKGRLGSFQPVMLAFGIASLLSLYFLLAPRRFLPRADQAK